MHDDSAMDRIVKDAMAAEAPRLSPAFDSRVLRRLRPRRLRPMGRVVMAVYVVAAAATAVGLMRHLPLELIAAAVAIGVAVAAGAGAYVRSLAVGHSRAGAGSALAAGDRASPAS